MPRPRLGDAPMTSAERQAKRREQFRRMKEALERIAATWPRTKAGQIAAEALAETKPSH